MLILLVSSDKIQLKLLNWTNMDRFLVNMAIVKVNFDKKGVDILDNYMPLVHETLNNMENDIFSINDFKVKFIDIAEFKIPTGAILSLLKRAENKYELLKKQTTGEYKIVREKINQNNFSTLRDAEQRKYNRLIKEFIKYCAEHIGVDIEEETVSTYFFEVLYDIAPALFMKISDIDKLKIEESGKNKFLVAKFISHANQYDQDSFEAILSFVRGSMLTETFYYSQNYSDISSKPLKNVIVYFDTQFLVRIIGFADKAICVPCEELNDMLKEMQVRMRCFRQTFDELYGIFFAAVSQLSQYGRLTSNKPGDVFDYINQNKITHSDLLMMMGTLEDTLKKFGIYVEERPDIIPIYSIDEMILKNKLSDAFENQSEKARNHDIDCLQAIFQMREGKPQPYLDKCKAIFITTNAKLARLSTLYFNENFGISDAPVCMADHVFTALVWMKAVKKAPDVPKDRLVANCYSALLPSESLWADYIKEINRLKDKGSLSEHDYHVLIHSITAREQLMDQAFSNEDNIFGSVEEILSKAKQVYTEEVDKKLSEVTQLVTNQNNKIDSIANFVENALYNITRWSMIIGWVSILLYGVIFTSPTSLTDFEQFGIKTMFFLVLVIFTLLNLIFGIRAIDHCQSVSQKIGIWASNKVKNLLKAT